MPRTKQLVKELEKTRQSLIRIINQTFSELVTNLEISDNEVIESKIERVIPLAADPEIFHKKKPVAIVIGSERITALSWKSVYLKLLTRCNQDPLYSEKLLELRGVVVGRGRNHLSGTKEGMTHPVQIGDGLYAETHYNSSQIMKILVQRIMDVIQYDYSDISVVVKI